MLETDSFKSHIFVSIGRFSTMIPAVIVCLFVVPPLRELKSVGTETASNIDHNPSRTQIEKGNMSCVQIQDRLILAHVVLTQKGWIT